MANDKQMLSVKITPNTLELLNEAAQIAAQATIHAPPECFGRGGRRGFKSAIVERAIVLAMTEIVLDIQAGRIEFLLPHATEIQTD